MLKSKKILILETELYFNDVYHLLQRSLIKITYEADLSKKDVEKIQYLVNKVIEAKQILNKMAP